MSLMTCLVTIQMKKMIKEKKKSQKRKRKAKSKNFNSMTMKITFKMKLNILQINKAIQMNSFNLKILTQINKETSQG